MLINAKEYLQIKNEIAEEIKSAQQNAITGINRSMIGLYWKVGQIINKNKSWGSKFIENLARDIKLAFPNLRGFSFRNLKYMSQFANVYKDIDIWATPLPNLPWRHHIVLMDKLEDHTQREWYAKKSLENGWSSNILEIQIETNLYKRQALADKTTNFKDRLPAPQSELAQQALKDPYIFDFITSHEGMVEREIEDELVAHITKFLLELGTGFAFLGRQYHLEVEGEDFYIDLLFYNTKLRCYVVIELKANEFKPEYAGKLNFYVSAVDGMLKSEMDNPTVGILLCKKKKKLIVEYTLKDIDKPISVNEYKLLDKLPKEYENILPTAEDIEKRIKLQ
jgi:predicted nuclease of restriction endonuclease-like (RecB) superfamily